MQLSAEIKGLRYLPRLCKDLQSFDFEELEKAFETSGSFLLRYKGRESLAVSWWVSPKRTRSYPYSRVYDTLSFWGRKVTIIPILKDEGKEGERDFLQWDTISLMSLLGVYVVIAHYARASKSPTYPNKISGQKFDYDFVKKKLEEVLIYHSDALHWNLREAESVGTELKLALDSYETISQSTGVEMHSRETAEKRLIKIMENRNIFVLLSRKLAEDAQKREIKTIQPKEKTKGEKAALTIKNYLGGIYFFTCDEVEVKGDVVFIKECKHTKSSFLPSLEDIKDGLLKMVIFSNLETIFWDNKHYKATAVLKLTRSKSNKTLPRRNLRDTFLSSLREEAEANNFKLEIVEV